MNRRRTWDLLWRIGIPVPMSTRADGNTVAIRIKTMSQWNFKNCNDGVTSTDVTLLVVYVKVREANRIHLWCLSSGQVKATSNRGSTKTSLMRNTAVSVADTFNLSWFQLAAWDEGTWSYNWDCSSCIRIIPLICSLFKDSTSRIMMGRTGKCSSKHSPCCWRSPL